MMARSSKIKMIDHGMCVLIVLITILLSAYAHQVAGFTLPLPWDDEASFVWPAISFMEQGTLQSDYINPDRSVMWMPPGYMIILGSIFRVTGYSLGIARWISWAFLIIAYLAAIGLLWNKPIRLLTISFCSALWLGATFVTIGNIARMDSLTFALALCGILLIDRKRFYLGLAVLLSNVLIHPNALYFLFIAIGYALFIYRAKWPRMNKYDVLALVLACACLGLYGIYVLKNLDAFLSDMAMQFGRKANRNPLAYLLSGPNLWYFIPLAIAALVCAVRRSHMLLYVGLAAACFCVSRIGREMWYEAYAEYSFVMMGIGILWIALHIFRKLRMNVVISYLALVIMAFPILLFHYRNGFIPGPRNWPTKLSWGWGMKTETTPPYFIPSDDRTIRNEIENMLSNFEHSPVKISFYPRGEGLFFHHAWKEKAHVFAPHFTAKCADIHVVRESRYTPPWQQERSRRYVSELPSGVQPLIVRDETEKWYIYLEDAQNNGNANEVLVTD